MTALVPIEQSKGPLAMQQRRASGMAALNQNFADGVRDAFPLLSIKGKVFRARISGQETPFIDPQTRQAIAFLDVVLVNASRTLSKAYYIKGFAEGSLDAPDCWSMNSIQPDPSVANKVSLTCVNCPMNQFGSRTTDNGKMAKACQDARRIAVVMPHQLGTAEPLVLMLRVPQSSLKNLKAYAQLLDRHSYEPNGCVTRLQFDYQEAYPKLVFNFVGPLDDTQYGAVMQLAEGPVVEGMLMAPDFEPAPSTTPKQTDTVGGLVQQAGPVLEDAAIIPAKGPVLATEPINVEPQAQATGLASTLADTGSAPVQSVASTVIELPDGKLFDTATNSYVERSQPAVQMPQEDPAVIKLPDGKFFHSTKKAFVTGPNVGDPVVGPDATPPAKPARAPRKPKEPAATAAATGQQQQVQPNSPGPILDAAAKADVDAEEAAKLASLVGGAVANQNSGGNAQAQPVHANGATPTVGAAPQDLESILNSLLPPNNA